MGIVERKLGEILEILIKDEEEEKEVTFRVSHSRAKK